MSGRNWVVPLVAGAVGACLGSVVTANVVAPPPAAGPRGADAAELQRAFSAALQPLQKTLDERLRAVEAEVARPRADAPSESAPGAVRHAAAAREEEIAAPAAPARTALRLPDEKRLEEFKDWSGDGDLRRKWLLTSEAALLEQLGAPDDIIDRGSREDWVYWTTNGNLVTRTTVFQLARGRVVTFWSTPHNPPSELVRARR